MIFLKTKQRQDSLMDKNKNYECKNFHHHALRQLFHAV